MNSETYFYSSVTSPYISHCAFVVAHKTGPKLVVVQLRKEGVFCDGIQSKDLGATVSNDYLPIGYNFLGVKPLITI
jgi:hypothetical protein